MQVCAKMEGLLCTTAVEDTACALQAMLEMIAAWKSMNVDPILAAIKELAQCVNSNAWSD